MLLLLLLFFRVLLNMTDHLCCKRCFLSAMAILAKVELYLATKDPKSDSFFCYTRTGLLWFFARRLNSNLSVPPADGAERCCCSTALQHLKQRNQFWLLQCAWTAACSQARGSSEISWSVDVWVSPDPGSKQRLRRCLISSKPLGFLHQHGKLTRVSHSDWV